MFYLSALKYLFLFSILFYVLPFSWVFSQVTEKDGPVIGYQLPLPESNRVYLPAPSYSKTSGEPKVLNLPFIDNFTNLKYDVYNNAGTLDTNKWFISENVRIYRSMAINPADFGAACFDGLKGNGYPHVTDPLSINGYSDSILTHYINTSALTERKDSMMVSFYLQKAGYGSPPGNSDTFFVQCRNKEGRFQTLFSYPGPTPIVIPTNSFKYIELPLKVKEYFHDKFQVKFVSRGYMNGAYSNWHLDYVYINTNRPENDSAIYDLATVKPISNFLAPYSALPVQYLDTNITPLKLSPNTMRYRNYGAIEGNTGVYSSIEEIKNVPTTFISPGQSVRTSFPPNSIFEASSGVVVPKNYHKSISDKKNILFEITNYVNSTENDLTNSNDTLRQYIHADSILAVDDGEFESWLGVRTPKAMGQRFDILADDTLRAVWLYFQPREALMDTFTPVRFRLGIWEDNPQNEVKPIFLNINRDDTVNVFPGWNRCKNIDSLHRTSCQESKSPNQMVRYPFEKSIFLKKGKYIIGMIQLQKFTPGNNSGALGLGMDYSYDNSANMLYQDDLTWKKFGVIGTMAIRLDFDSPYSDWVSRPDQKFYPHVAFNIYPIPTNGKINLQFLNNQESPIAELRYTLFDALGREIETGKLNSMNNLNEICFSKKNTGIYTLITHIKLNSGQIQTNHHKIVFAE